MAGHARLPAFVDKRSPGMRRRSGDAGVHLGWGLGRGCPRRRDSWVRTRRKEEGAEPW